MQYDCPICGCGMARYLQKRRGVMRPYPIEFLTCCNPACRIVVNIKTGEKYKKGKLIFNKEKENGTETIRRSIKKT